MIQRDFRDVMMENENRYAKLVIDIFKKIRCLPGHKPMILLDVFLDQDGKELYPIELMLISQIIPFMFITAKHTSVQQGLKGQCVLVLADLKKVQTSLTRACNDDH